MPSAPGAQMLGEDFLGKGWKYPIAFNERLIGRMREQADVRQYLVEDDE